MSSVLGEGEWIYREISRHWSKQVVVYKGTWKEREKVKTISKYCAMALARWHGDPSLYFSVPVANQKRIDVRIVGDLSSFFETRSNL